MTATAEKPKAQAFTPIQRAGFVESSVYKAILSAERVDHPRMKAAVVHLKQALVEIRAYFDDIRGKA
jgi:hypothetical protein